VPDVAAVPDASEGPDASVVPRSEAEPTGAMLYDCGSTITAAVAAATAAVRRTVRSCRDRLIARPPSRDHSVLAPT
jgi:hypothetical protein